MGMRRMKLLVGLVLLLAASLGFADNGTVQLTTLPTITVADGRSTVTVSAYVRRTSGQPVPDGTQVLFSTSLGTIKDASLVQTANGVARVVLQTGTIPGTAKITATALGTGAINTVDLEFLSDRALLSTAKEYVEIVAAGYMSYSLDQKVLGAAGINHGAKLRYREIEIDADDLQLNIPAYEVRAKKAHLKMGKVNQNFDELNLKLTSRKGVGTTTVTPASPIVASAVGQVPWFEATHDYFGLANIRSGGISPFSETFDPTQFTFLDLSDSTSLILAKKAVVFPQKEIQFQRAEILVGGVKVLKLPLYEQPLNTASNIATDQMFGIQNNQLLINYPYYLTLRPGQTSLFRLTTGQDYGSRGLAVNRGLALNYELGWNKGNDFDGGLTLSGTTSRTWDLSAHQYIRFDDRTSATAFFDMPEGQSYFTSLNFIKQFDGYGLSVNTSTSHTISGNRFDSNQMTMAFGSDPIKIGPLPLRTSVGVSANLNDTKTSIESRSQSSAGLYVRNQLIPYRLDRFTQFNGSFTVMEQSGRNTVSGLAFQGNAMLSRQFGNLASAILTYDYLENGFNSGLTGRHQLSFTGQLHQGNFGSNLTATKALDVDRVSLFADLSYQLARPWRLSYSYTLDRYIGNTYVDYIAALGFRIGIREVGLTFSGRTKRFGIQLLGTSFGY